MVVNGLVSCSVCFEDLGFVVGDVVVLEFVDDGFLGECGDECVCSLVACVKDVCVFRFGFLDDRVAFKLGFRSSVLLRRYLRLLFPDLGSDVLCFVYEFEVV